MGMTHMLYFYITHTCTVFETETRSLIRAIWMEPNRDCRSTRSKDGRFEDSSSKWCKLIGLLWVSIVDSYEVVSKIIIMCYILSLISEKLVAKKILLYAVMWYEMLTHSPYQNHRQFSISHFQCQPLLSRCNRNLLDSFLLLHIPVSLLSRAKSHWLLVDLSMGHLKWHKLITLQNELWSLILRKFHW